MSQESSRVGRNEPCPCGSGKKYKKCCIGLESGPQAGGLAAEAIAEIREGLEGRRFESLDEANAYAREITARRNSAPIEEFSGLSPDTMFRFLHFPFDSPGLVSFAEDFTAPRESTVMQLFTFLGEALGTGGLRATEKGNLPRDVCKDAHRRFGASCPCDSPSTSRYFKMTSEQDFFELHFVRLLAGQAGLLRKQRGRFLLTTRGSEAVEDATGSRAFGELFRAATRKINWGYFDRYPTYSIIQTGFLYSLLMLSRHGDRFRPETFYGELFLRAFPAVLDEAPVDSYCTPQEHVVRCHGLRTFSRFTLLFGLAEAKCEEGADRLSPLQVRKTPALDDFARFAV